METKERNTNRGTKKERAREKDNKTKDNGKERNQTTNATGVETGRTQRQWRRTKATKKGAQGKTTGIGKRSSKGKKTKRKN